MARDLIALRLRNKRVVMRGVSATNGMVIVHNFLDSHTCERLLKEINRYRQRRSVPKIYRPAGQRPLNYSVIDGERISQHLPELLELYQKVIRCLQAVGEPQVKPLDDLRVACNVNITANGGTYRYHYDRNGITAILYLNETIGGETECYPNYRLDWRTRKHAYIQCRLDQLLQTRALRLLFGKQTLVRPEPGKLLVMRGNRCLHSVRPVLGERERVNVVMAYDYANSESTVSEELNRYLYEDQRVQSADPNYKLIHP